MRRLLATAMLCLLTVPVQAEIIEQRGSFTIVGKDGQRYTGGATFTVTPKTRKAARKLRPVKAKPQRFTSRECLHGSTKDLLNRLEAKFGKVKLAKTCVPGARMPGGKPSWHASNRAFDFHVPKGARHGEVMVWLGKNSPGVTIGYSGRLAGIIHTDTGNFHKVIYRAASHEAGEKAVAIWQERARLAALAPVPQTQREADPPRQEPAPWSMTADYVDPSFEDHAIAAGPAPTTWGRDIFRRYVESKDVVVHRHVKFSCPGGKPLPVGLTTMLQDAAAHWQTTVYVNSFYRSPAYNRKVGGARQSRHIRCEAVDWRVAGVAPATLRAWVVKNRTKWKVTGVGTYRSHIHADIGRTRLVEWNGSRKRYAKRKSRYASAG